MFVPILPEKRDADCNTDNFLQTTIFLPKP